MKIFISGGCKTGKSTLALSLAKRLHSAKRPPYYLAAMRARDGEDEERIRRHQKEREGLGFETIEVRGMLLPVLETCEHSGVFLLDSLTALLAEAMFAQNGSIFPEAGLKLREELTIFIKELKDIVIVSDFIFSDAIIYEELTEKYRRALAALDRCAAELCDTVIETNGGIATVHKNEGGGLP